MANGKYTKRNRGVASKSLVMVLALVLVIGCTVGATLAYLTDKSGEVKNTFTIGKVDITLTETDNTKPNEGPKEGVQNTYMLMPGKEYTKDPKVTVENDSEDCYLFVEFVVTGNVGTYVDYTSTLSTANGWTQGDGTDIPANVWYRTVNKADTQKSWDLLENSKITIKSDLTNEDLAKAPTEISLAYNAYAIQLGTFEGKVADAWDEVSGN